MTLEQAIDSAVTSVVAGKSNHATARASVLKLFADVDRDQIDLAITLNVELRRRHREWDYGIEEGSLQAFPALELLPDDDGWEDIWSDAALSLKGLTTATDPSCGRMVAMKADPIWLALSDFGYPFPPFKIDYRADLEDVDWQDAVELGVMRQNDPVLVPQACAPIKIIGLA